MSKKETILDLYFNKHLKQKEIAKRLGPKTGEKSPSFGRIRLRNIKTHKTINVKPTDVQKYLDTNNWIIGGHITSNETK